MMILNQSTLQKFIAFSMSIALASEAYADIVNFGDPAFANFKNALNQNSVHIMQIGDSHTAADVMTDAVRVRLQSVMGDGGMGYAMPMWFRGQAMARVSYDNSGFTPISSRTTTDDYTLGGMIASPNYQGATLTLKPKKPQARQRLIVSIKQDSGYFSGIDATGERFVIQAPVKNNTWQLTQINATLPFTITANNTGSSAIGGFWGINTTGSGAVVSALGINGAQIDYFNRWNSLAYMQELASLQPSLVILAYGTNEAHSGTSAATMTNSYSNVIQKIRQASPATAIMLTVAPESLTSTAGSCGTRSQNLNEIQQAQYAIAKTHQTLLWDWQTAMGGSCSMKSWINQGLAAKDGVHFSKSGYQKIGKQLADDLLALKTASYQSAPTVRPTITPNSGNGRMYINWSKQ